MELIREMPVLVPPEPIFKNAIDVYELNEWNISPNANLKMSCALHRGLLKIFIIYAFGESCLIQNVWYKKCPG